MPMRKSQAMATFLRTGSYSGLEKGNGRRDPRGLRRRRRRSDGPSASVTPGVANVLAGRAARRREGNPDGETRAGVLYRMVPRKMICV